MEEGIPSSPEFGGQEISSEDWEILWCYEQVADASLRLLYILICKSRLQISQLGEQISQADSSVKALKKFLFEGDFQEKYIGISRKLAHDLRNLLGPLCTQIEVLSTIQASSTATEIEDSCLQKFCNLYSGIFPQIRWFLKSLEHERQTPATPLIQRVSLQELISEAHPCFQYLVSKIAKLEINIPSHLPLVHINPYQVLTIIIEMIRNAQRRGENADKIKINARRNGKELISLEISDNGTGILLGGKIEKIEDIFIPGVSGGESTGLGLSTALNDLGNWGGQMRVLAHGGLPSRPELHKIQEEHGVTTQERNGALFILELPRAVRRR